MASIPALSSPRHAAPRRIAVSHLQGHQFWIGATLLLAVVVLAVIGPILVPLQEYTLAGPDLAPSIQHLMGTGTHSQDVFSEWVFAARYSLTVGFLAGVGSTVLSIVVGVVAGYVGGRLDAVVSFVINLFLAVPPFPAIFVLAFSTGAEGIAPLVTVIVVMTWAYGAGLLRTQTISIKQREFIQASVTAGERSWPAVWHEVLPHLRGLTAFVLVNAVLVALQTEFGLEFLGWGALANSNGLGGGWGIMLSNARYDNDFEAGVWWTWAFPGLGITLTSVALALIGSGVVAMRGRLAR